MKLATFDDGAGARVGLVTDAGLIDLARAAPGLPTTMIGLIEAWDTARAAVADQAGKG